MDGWVSVILPVFNAERFVAQTPDKANANLRGRLTLPLSDRHPDYAALQMANFIFGLDGSSRLWTRIRERDGLSYDVRSTFDWSSLDDNTSWNLSAIFAPQNQPRVEAAFKEELARSLKDGFTAEELAAGRTARFNFPRFSAPSASSNCSRSPADNPSANACVCEISIAIFFGFRSSISFRSSFHCASPNSSRFSTAGSR